MKKLLLTLVALIMAVVGFNTASAQLYVTGIGGNWTMPAPVTVQANAEGNYVFTTSTEFKMSTTNGSNWDNDFNPNALVPATTLSSTVQTQTVALKKDSGPNFMLPYGNGGVEFTITVNSTFDKVTVTGATPPVAGEYTNLYLAGTNSNWGFTNDWKFQTTDGNLYTMTGKTLANNTEFKVAGNNWSPNYGDAGAVTLNTETTLVQGSNPGNCTLAVGGSNLTISFNATTKAFLISNEGKTVSGSTESNPYEDVWVNCRGDFNGWQDNGVHPNTEGIATFTELPIGTSEFEIKYYKTEDIYYGTSTPVTPNQWIQLEANNTHMTIAGATNDATYNVQFDVVNNKLYVTPVNVVNPDGPAYISVAFGSNGMFNFPVQSDDDVKLYPSAATPGIYEGVIPFKRGAAFAFFTDENVAYTGTTSGPYLGISLSQTYWPISDSEDDEDNMIGNHLMANNDIRMYVSSFTSGYPSSTASVKVSIDWTNQTFSLELMPYDYKAPEELYVWGTEMGFYGSGYKNMAAMKPISSGSHIYECTLSVPECGPFEPDGEFSPMEGDPNYGFYFYLTDSATSKGGTGVISYLAPAESHLIEIPEAGNSFSTQLLYNNTGVTMVALSPGYVRMNYDYDRNNFTMTMLTPEGEVATSSVTFRFTGIENASQYVSIFDTVNEEAVETSSSFTYEFTEYAALSVAMTEENVEDGYSFTISCNGEQSGETYTLTGMDMDDSIQYMLGLYPGADGFVFTINVTKEDVEPEPEPNVVTFRFEGVENAYSYVSIFDMNNATALETSNSFTYEYAESAALSIAMTEENVDEGYSFTISCNGEQSDETYTLTGMGMDDSIQYMLGLYPGADGYVFTITVSKTIVEPEPEPKTVYFTLTGVENAYDYVTIFDTATGSVLDAAASVSYQYVNTASLSIAMSEVDVEEGYAFTVSCEHPQSPDTYSLSGIDMDDAIQYMLALYPGADGYKFTINVTYNPEDSGILNLLTEGENLTVYNVNGMVVARNAAAADIKALAPGLYIANGKKIIVK